MAFFFSYAIWLCLPVFDAYADLLFARNGFHHMKLPPNTAACGRLPYGGGAEVAATDVVVVTMDKGIEVAIKV